MLKRKGEKKLKYSDPWSVQVDYATGGLILSIKEDIFHRKYDTCYTVCKYTWIVSGAMP